MRVLVTGAAGFIGSSLVDRLLGEGHSVVGVDNFDPYYAPAQKRLNIRRALSHPGYRFLEGDVRRAEDVATAFRDGRIDLVMHLAAKAGVRASLEDPVAYAEVNELGMLQVARACQRSGNIPLVLASTSSVYAAGRTPFREDDPAVTPISPYAATKRGAELMASALHHTSGLPVAVLRFFTVYGPRGRPDMAVSLFTRKLLAGEPIRVHGRETARDFTYIDDITAGISAAMGWLLEHRGFGTFNIGRGEPASVPQLIELLAAELGLEARTELAPLGVEEPPVTWADVSRAKAAFGYAPAVSLAEGIHRWALWVRSSDEVERSLHGVPAPRLS
jgi:UDP-glucuronate 4-epimerase